MTEKTKRKKFPRYSGIAATLILALLVLAACAGSGCVSHQDTTSAPATAAPPAISPDIATASSAIPTGTGQVSGTTLRRIIVTNADAAELLLAIGAGDRVVGISDTVKNHPVLGSRFAGKASIGSWQAPDIETILSLHPDAVISYSSYTPKNADRITSAGIPLLLIDCYKIDTLASDARRLGNLTGRDAEAEEYVAFLEQYEAQVQSRTAAHPPARPPRVYIESYSDYSALTGGSGGDLLVTMAGGENIAGLLPVSSPKVNAEWVTAQDPDVIIKTAASGKNETELREIHAKLVGRTGIANTSAVRTGRVYVISGSVTYGPRSVIGLAWVAGILNPDTSAAIRPREIQDEYAGRFVAATNTTAAIYPQPG
ncbi:MAG: ABC transporter substrate-binding protein [Methanoregula sp.]|nr:ABC transporter substrate-binding protein [Methanoregula sp.]